MSSTGSGLPWEGNYSSWLEQKQPVSPTADKADSARRRTLEAELEWVRLSPERARPRARPDLSAYGPCWPRRRRTRGDGGSSWRYRQGPALATSWSRRRAEQGVRRSPAHRRTRLLAASRRYRRRDRRERGGQDHALRMITGQEKPDEGSLVVGPTVSLATSTSRVRPSIPPHGVRGDHRPGQDHLIVEVGRSRTRVRGRLQLHGIDQQKKVGDCSGGSAIASTGQGPALGEATSCSSSSDNDLRRRHARALEDALLAYAGCAC